MPHPSRAPRPWANNGAHCTSHSKKQVPAGQQVIAPELRARRIVPGIATVVLLREPTIRFVRCAVVRGLILTRLPAAVPDAQPTAPTLVPRAASEARRSATASRQASARMYKLGVLRLESSSRAAMMRRIWLLGVSV